MLPKKQYGFTLLEILIVMVIMSIVAGFAVMTISYNRNSQVEQIAKQLKNIITLAEEEAILQSTTLGLAFTQHSFQFYQYQEKKTSVGAIK